MALVPRDPISRVRSGSVDCVVLSGEFDKAVSPAIILLVSWVGTWLRHPQMLWSMTRQRSGSGAKRIDGGGMMRVRHKLALGGD
jgi:hypothetical protein